MDKVYIGYISGPFGLSGEVKVISETNHKSDIFKIGNPFYIDDKKYIIKSVKNHNKYEIISFEGIESINDINHLIKKDIYINKGELGIQDFLLIELLNLEINDGEKIVGKVKEILYNKKCSYIKDDKLIIPLIDKYVKEVDLEKKVIYVQNLGDLL